MRIRTISCEFGIFFRVYTNNPDLRLFFPKTVIIRTKLDTNSCISGLCEFEFLKFVSSCVLMISVFEKNNRESELFVYTRKNSRISMKSCEIARIPLNSLEFASRIREKSCDFGRICLLI
jgi:hypothetical protein